MTIIEAVDEYLKGGVIVRPTGCDDFECEPYVHGEPDGPWFLRTEEILGDWEVIPVEEDEEEASNAGAVRD